MYRRRAERVALLVAAVPFIRLVGLNGSLARNEARLESDIDFLIITTPGRIYTARFLTTLLVHLLGLRRYKDRIRGRICLNRYQTTQHLGILPENEYHARVFSQLIPLVDIDDTYRAYQEKNQWMETMGFPVVSPRRHPSRSLVVSGGLRRLGEWVLGGWLGTRFESLLGRYQQAKIMRNPLTRRYPDRIQATDSVLLFHPPAAGEIDDDLERWDAAAESYNSLQGQFGDGFRRSILDPELLRLLGSPSGQYVLDAGCGNGYLTHRLHELGAEVVGIDGSSVMIARARQNFPGLDFRVADLTQSLPWPDQVFDGVVSSMVIHALSDPLRMLSELHRVTKKTGYLLLALPHPAFAYPTGRLHRSLWDRIRHRPAALTVTSYHNIRRVTVPMAGLSVPTNRYHRPLAWYSDQFSTSGWKITAISEPTGSISGHWARGHSPQTETIPLTIIFRLERVDKVPQI